LIYSQQLFLGTADLFGQIGKSDLLIEGKIVQFYVHLIVPPRDFRLSFDFLLLLPFQGRTDEVPPSWRAVIDDACEVLGVLMAEEVSTERKVVRRGVVLLYDH
jgi:hypothetical protein